MNEADILEIGRDSLTVILKSAGPIMVVGLVVGLAIALFQALTTIQELTLTFVPKIISIFIVVIVFLRYMMNIIFGFSLRQFDRMSSLG